MKKHINRILAMAMAASAMVTFAACGNDEAAKNPDEPTATASAEVSAKPSASASQEATASIAPKASPDVSPHPAVSGESGADDKPVKESKQESGKPQRKGGNSTGGGVTPQAESVPEAVSTPVLTPAPTRAPTPEPTPEPEMEWAGSSYGQAVCSGVNEVREMYGMAPLEYGGSGGLEGEVEEMARAGSIWGASSRRSVSQSNDGGKSMGVFSASHASEIGQGEYSTLYVASVKYNGKRYTIVEAG